MANRPPRNEDFPIVIICALPVEYDAVALIFDEFWSKNEYPQPHPSGGSGYIQTGRIGKHNAVLCLLHNLGVASAAITVSKLNLTYTGLQLAILAGICSGVPSPGTDNEILLGDVIIGNIVVDYDLGRNDPRKFIKKGNEDGVKQPSKDVRANFPILYTQFGLSYLQERSFEILEQLQQTAIQVGCRTHYDRPAAEEDILFEPNYPHRHRDPSDCSCGEGSTCTAASTASCTELQCDVEHQVLRKRLESRRKRQVGEKESTANTQESRIHLGRTGLGESIFTSGELRDRVAREHAINAFEPNGTAILLGIPYIVVRGVCDYADGHKGSKSWLDFAAAMAASVTRAFLEYYETKRPTTTGTPHLVPYRENPTFIGRSDILEHIKQVFRDRHSEPRQFVPGRSLRIVLYGPAGIGKSQIALAYVYWLRDAHPKVSVFWVAARTVEGFRQAYHSIAEKHHIRGRDDPQVDIISLVKTWLAKEYRVQWLMVIDHIERTELSLDQADLECYIPEYRHGAILFTTRDEQTGLELAQGGPIIKVGKMTESEARQLFQMIAGTETPVENVTALCVRLDHEPRAIVEAAGFILENDISIDEYLDRCNTIADSYADRQRDDGVYGPDASASSDTPKGSLPSPIQSHQRDLDEGIEKSFADDTSTTERRGLPPPAYGTTRIAPDRNGLVIPIEAKWTRIRRSLVSPEILERAGVRYEARPDYVAVLGVLTHEEITNYARQSAEARAARSSRHNNGGPGHWEASMAKSERSITFSGSESGASSSRWSQLFSGKLASTKLSSLEEEMKHTKEHGGGKQEIENFYSYTETADNRPNDDNDDEIRSLVSGPEDIQSQDGSGTAHWAVTTAAVSYLAEVLTEDLDLAPLYLDAAQRLEDARFIQNHRRLLKRYYLFLRSQTPSQKQRAAIDFLRPRSHRVLISRKVLEKMQSHDETKRERVHVTLPQYEERNLTLERYLNNIEPTSKGLPADAVETAPDFDEDQSSMDEEDYHSINSLVDLEETRSFFVSGKPLAKFKAEFRDFLNIGREQGKDTPQMESTKSVERPKVLCWRAKLSAWIFDLCSPPKPGNQRVRYICECGDNMFLDVRELSPGGIGRFRERFARDGLASFAAARDSTTDVPSGVSPPPAAHLRHERSPSTASNQGSELTSSSSTTRSSNSSTSSLSDEPSLREEPSNPQYLLVCINQKSLPILVHIECSSFENDQYLCREILENYRMIREDATWKTAFLVPLSVANVINGVSKFLEQRTPSWLQWISRLFRSLSDTSLFKMDTGDFVRFQLVPVGEADVPNHFKCGEFPPCSEVKAGNYLYEPVPMVDVALASIPLWHLTRPGRHSDKYWITTFPKKLRYHLRREAGVYGKPAIGWGIRVNERFNWGQFLFLILAVIVMIGAIMGVYLALKADDSSGFGLAAFLAAVAAIYIPHQYFAWKERLD